MRFLLYKSPVEVTETAAAIWALVKQSATGVVHCGGPRTSVYDFHCEAMRSLGLSTDSIVPTQIPDDMDVARDCSLETDSLTKLTGISPTPVREAINS
jgi:dTDP-4-dehydrorhamnose reductase